MDTCPAGRPPKPFNVYIHSFLQWDFGGISQLARAYYLYAPAAIRLVNYPSYTGQIGTSQVGT